MQRLMEKVRSYVRPRSSVVPVRLAEPEVLQPKALPLVGLFGLLTDEQKRSAFDPKLDASFGDQDYRRP